MIGLRLFLAQFRDFWRFRARFDDFDLAVRRAQDADAVLDALRRFLSFARGAAASLPVRWGTAADGSIVWEQWGGQPVDPWKGRDTWFDGCMSSSSTARRVRSALESPSQVALLGPASSGP
jgi:hypothetical protein